MKLLEQAAPIAVGVALGIIGLGLLFAFGGDLPGIKDARRALS